ncbi:hypothetical protein [Acetobacter persici]
MSTLIRHEGTASLRPIRTCVMTVHDNQTNERVSARKPLSL